MTELDRSKSVLKFAPRPEQIVAIVREIAQNSGRVGFGDHAIERMEERGITRLDALRVLRGGDLSGRVTAGRVAGEWKCKIVLKLRGNREVGVVTVVIKNQRLFVKTVEWEDT